MLLSRDGLDQAEKAGRTLPQFLVDLGGSSNVKLPIHVGSYLQFQRDMLHLLIGTRVALNTRD